MVHKIACVTILRLALAEPVEANANRSAGASVFVRV